MSVYSSLGTAGFSLSRALFRKKMCRPLTCRGSRPYFSWKKNWRPFLVITICQLSVLQCHSYLFSPEKTSDLFFAHHCRFYSFHSFTRVSPIISGMLLCFKKFAAPLVEAFFVFLLLLLVSSCVFLYLPCIYLVRPCQPIIDQQGPGLSGLIHKEAHPVAPYPL